MDGILKKYVIWSVMIGSFMISFILLAFSTPTFSFVHGQTDLLLSNNSSSNNSDLSKELGPAFYTESTKSTNIKVVSIDAIPTVEVTYNGNSTIGGAPTQTIGTIVD